MRWYFVIDEGGTNGVTGDDAKVAVQSALSVGGLEPILIYHGAPNEFTRWMERHGVRVIPSELRFMTSIRSAELAGTYKSHSIGHWLRVVVPLIEDRDEFVLYTDCDVVFMTKFNWDIFHPNVFAAAPAAKKDNWNYFNAGVMVINVPAMYESYDRFEKHITSAIGDPNKYHFDDELALNQFYRRQWDRLDPRMNWKPYWGFDPNITLLHFHGPKLNVIEMINNGTWPRENSAQIQLARMIDGHIEAYIGWLSYLGERIQIGNPGLAVRMLKAADKLSLRRKEVDTSSIDLDFLNFNMFPD